MTHRRAGRDGASSLDRGTPYAVCLTGSTKIPEYEISMTKQVTAADCPAGSTFIPRTSNEALPARSAATGASCAGLEADSCVMKYHKYSGLPIWGATTVQIRAFDAGADGPLCTGPHHSDRGAFGLVQLPDSRSIFQMLLDKDTGKGVYVQVLTNPLDWSHIYGTALDREGNLYAVGNLYGNMLHGNDFDLLLPFDSPKDTDWKSYLVAFKFATGPQETPITPPCISSCADGTLELVPNTCYIDNMCYDEFETAELVLNEACLKCSPSFSQTEFVEGCDPTSSPSTQPVPVPTPAAPTNPQSPTGPATDGEDRSNSGTESDESGLSGGGVAGIVVAVVVGVGILATLAVVTSKRSNEEEVVDVDVKNSVDSSGAS